MADADVVEADMFLEADEWRDFALVVEGQKVFVDRRCLAMWSPVLKLVFFPEGEPFEQPEGGLEMKQKKLDEFLTFLHAICPTSSKALRVDAANVEVLVAYAAEYQVGVLRERCVEFVSGQLKGDVVGETLIDYLRIATFYSLKDLQMELVPLVGQLSIDKIKAVHAELPLCVLAAVYESKASSQLASVESAPTLPLGAFRCSRCGKSACTMTYGASSCCSESVVALAESVVAQVPLSFSCAKCGGACSLKNTYSTGVRYSSCCGDRFFVRPDLQLRRSADTAATVGPVRKVVRFSVDLLDRQQ